MTTAHTKINRGTKTGADKAAEHLPALTRAYGRTLRAAGRRAAERMRQTHPILAAADPQQPPNLVPPPAGQLIDQQELADDTQRKTAKLHKQMLTASAQSALQPFDISFDIRAPTSQAILDAVAARIQGTITSAIEEQITEAIQDGYANGYSVDRVSRNIVTATDKISKVRADMLARTDLNALSNAGSLLGATTADAASTKTWLATEDERTRETHSDADGQTVPINDVFTVGGESAQYPGDPDLSWEESANCFPGETLVAAASFAGGFRRWYDGDLILVETDAEHRLSGTPNHPVLTSTGWKSLGDLEHGDYLVCGTLIQKEAGVDPNVDHVPAKIEEVFAALDVVGNARRITGSNVNFHGEVPDGEVDVVGANGLLRNEGDTASSEPLSEHHFSASDMNLAGFFPSGSPREVFGTSLHATDGIMGGGAQAGTLFRCRARHTREHSFGAVARLNAELDQTAADYGTADIVELGERLLGFPCEVSLSKVVKRNVSAFHGFVYNLQVGEHESYVAGSVIAHNCRCTLVYGQPLTASAALERFRDHLWEGSFDYDLVAHSPDGAITSGGNMPTIDVATLTHEERETLAAQLAEPLSPEAARLVEVRSALAAGGFADAFDDEQLAAIILVSEALSLSPASRALRVSLTDFALLAAAAGGTPWTATLCVAGVPTVDSGIKRLLSTDGGSWLPLPLPLAIMDDSPHADIVSSSPMCGRIDEISVAGNVYQASGVFFDDSDDPDVAAAGARAAAMVKEMRRMGVSVDMVDCDWDMMVYDASSVSGLEDMLDEVNDPTQDDVELAGVQIAQPGDMPIEAEMDPGVDPDDIEYIMVAKQWVIAGATICPVQALTDAMISLVAAAFSGRAEWRSETDFDGDVEVALTAAAAGLVPLEPPVDWFSNPELDGPTPLTVTDEGRVFGHLATWDTCHTGLPGCVPPPRSPTGYMNFHLGEIKAEGGERISVGTLSFDKGHAGLRDSFDRTVAHYDNTETAGAHVRAGEDKFGIWLAGALNPRISAEEARVLMAAPPSGDWRQVRKGEGKDLVGALAVNIPGFPVPRERKGLTLQASACAPCDEALERELTVLAASADGIEGLAELVA